MHNQTETTYFAGGCFWGVEYYFQIAPGVVSTKVGFMGGEKHNPSYEQVCSHTTAHAEVVEVVFDPQKTSFEELAKLFFEIHDPGQLNKQGPDIGNQYRSAIFYTTAEQKIIAQKLINILVENGHKVVTELVQAKDFWEAEEYHQKYYSKNGNEPYCHKYIKKF